MKGVLGIDIDFATRVYDTARAQGLNDVQAKILVAQAKHESGNFKSGLFLDDANAFGMKMPSVRKSPYIDGASTLHKPPSSEGGKYAHFRSIEDSVKDLIHRHNNFRINWASITTLSGYFNELVRTRYFTDLPSSYSTALARHYNTIKSQNFA